MLVNLQCLKGGLIQKTKVIFFALKFPSFPRGTLEQTLDTAVPSLADLSRLAKYV